MSARAAVPAGTDRAGSPADVSELVADAARLAALDALHVLDTPPEEGFDDAVALARDICDTPVALVSLVGRDRQWFKARAGFAPAETALDCSVCAHAMAGGDVLVIPDLLADGRTADNPLVTGPEAIRFYAGAPLASGDGHPLGALCVIDTVPRPDGLSARQADALRRLARQVERLLETRRLLGQRDALLTRLRTANLTVTEDRRRLASLFDNAPSFMALQRGPDHVYELVNPAYREMIGGRDVIGLPVRTALPDATEQGYADILDRVYRTGEPFTMRAARYVAEPGADAPPLERFLDFLYQPFVEDGRITGIFTVGYDATERVRQVRRQEALAELGERLRTVAEAEEVTRSAAEIMARALDATRAGIGTVDPEAETVRMHPNWRAPGAATVEGLFRFADYGSYLDALKRGETVIVPDVATDPRTAAGAAALLTLGIRVLVNFPVIELGRLVLVAFVHFAEHRPLSEEDLLFVRQVADRTQAALARLEAERQQETLNRELAHRMKNLLATVQAIANQTLRRAPSLDQARETMEDRLMALARAQDLLVAASATQTDIRQVVAAAIEPHVGDDGRIAAEGPALRLSPDQALGLSLALHELATNAAKHGALSNLAGAVRLDWRAEAGLVHLRWVESGGPPVTAPSRRGFGSRLIERIAASYFGGEARLDFDPAGVRFTLSGRSAGEAA